VRYGDKGTTYAFAVGDVVLNHGVNAVGVDGNFCFSKVNPLVYMCGVLWCRAKKARVGGKARNWD